MSHLKWSTHIIKPFTKFWPKIVLFGFFADDRVFQLFHRNLSDALTQLAQAIYNVLSRKIYFSSAKVHKLVLLQCRQAVQCRYTVWYMCLFIGNIC